MNYEQLEAEANGEQWKRMPRDRARDPGAAAEADTSGKQQLKRAQSGRAWGSSAQRAVRRRITHGRRTKGK